MVDENMERAFERAQKKNLRYFSTVNKEFTPLKTFKRILRLFS